MFPEVSGCLPGVAVDVGDAFPVRHPRPPRRRDRPLVRVPVVVQQRIRRPRHLLRQRHVPVQHPVRDGEEEHRREYRDGENHPPKRLGRRVFGVRRGRRAAPRHGRFAEERQVRRVVPEHLRRDAQRPDPRRRAERGGAPLVPTGGVASERLRRQQNTCHTNCPYDHQQRRGYERQHPVVHPRRANDRGTRATHRLSAELRLPRHADERRRQLGAGGENLGL